MASAATSRRSNLGVPTQVPLLPQGEYAMLSQAALRTLAYLSHRTLRTYRQKGAISQNVRTSGNDQIRNRAGGPAGGRPTLPYGPRALRRRYHAARYLPCRKRAFTVCPRAHQECRHIEGEGGPRSVAGT